MFLNIWYSIPNTENNHLQLTAVKVKKQGGEKMDERKLNSSRSIKSISAKVQRENNYILHQQKKEMATI